MRFESSKVKRLQSVSKSVEPKLNYKEVLQKNIEMKSRPQNRMLQVSSKEEDNSRWQNSVVCKRNSIKSSWTKISKVISDFLDKEVVLYPFQCNKALLFCSSEEEAEWVARHKKITVNIQDEVSLCRWKQNCNFHGKRKFVSFGGWIEIEGLPFNLWNKEMFKHIGDACGGYLEIDYRTKKFLSLFVARIKVKTNEYGLIPEFVDVIGNFESFYVRIHPATLSNRLTFRENPHRKIITTKESARELSCQCQTVKHPAPENQKAVVENFPARLTEVAGDRLPGQNQTQGTCDRFSGECGTHAKRNVLGDEKGTEAWKTGNGNTQVEILKGGRLVDDDKAEPPMCVLKGQANKEVRPLGGFKNGKWVDADKTTRAKSVDTGPTLMDQKQTDHRRYNDVTHFKRLSPELFGGKQNPQLGEKHEKVKKFVLQNGSVDLEEDQEEEQENSAEGDVFHEEEDAKELTIEGNSQVNCALENEIRELSEMHSNVDFMKETGLGNDDFEELLSGFNNDNSMSSESEAEDLISSSEDEEEVSVLDSHEGILNDLFKEDDGKLDLISQGQKDEKKHLKKIKPKFAAANMRQTKVASTSVENSVERMGSKERDVEQSRN
ncbi:hypothetical protein M0R45_026473 [Rubus argutus]|uniref:DUF4283 domain-containing protein n=1 Tax=Rubus argutus TaxID=59490 RepID=A0AAW1WXQ3_RUBAR